MKKILISVFFGLFFSCASCADDVGNKFFMNYAKTKSNSGVLWGGPFHEQVGVIRGYVLGMNRSASTSQLSPLESLKNYCEGNSSYIQNIKDYFKKQYNEAKVQGNKTEEEIRYRLFIQYKLVFQLFRRARDLKLGFIEDETLQGFIDFINLFKDINEQLTNGFGNVLSWAHSPYSSTYSAVMSEAQKILDEGFNLPEQCVQDIKKFLKDPLREIIQEDVAASYGQDYQKLKKELAQEYVKVSLDKKDSVAKKVYIASYFFYYLLKENERPKTVEMIPNNVLVYLSQGADQEKKKNFKEHVQTLFKDALGLEEIVRDPGVEERPVDEPVEEGDKGPGPIDESDGGSRRGDETGDDSDKPFPYKNYIGGIGVASAVLYGLWYSGIIDKVFYKGFGWELSQDRVERIVSKLGLLPAEERKLAIEKLRNRFGDKNADVIERGLEQAEAAFVYPEVA